VNILDAIGNTSIVRLGKVVPPGCADILVRLEWEPHRQHEGGPAGAHRIEGIGIGRTPPLCDPTLVDGILPVHTDDAEDMARRLAREEALFAGMSAGANVVAAIRVAQRLGPGAKVVILMVDSGLKYVSTDVYGS